jgi:hypothetical protein
MFRALILKESFAFGVYWNNQFCSALFTASDRRVLCASYIKDETRQSAYATVGINICAD